MIMVPVEGIEPPLLLGTWFWVRRVYQFHHTGKKLGPGYLYCIRAAQYRFSSLGSSFSDPHSVPWNNTPECYLFRSMVRVKGLEPPRCEPPEPKSGASTNFATLAISYLYWCLETGSNRRHLVLQTNALPTELPRQISITISKNNLFIAKFSVFVNLLISKSYVVFIIQISG